MSITVREYGENDINGMISVWNEVVRDGVAFPQTEELDFESGKSFLQNKLVVPLQPMKTARFSECIFFIRIMSADAVIFVMQAMRFPHRQGEKVSAENLCRIALSVLKIRLQNFAVQCCCENQQTCKKTL